MGYKLTYASPKGQPEVVLKTVYRSEAVMKMFDDILLMHDLAGTDPVQVRVELEFTASDDYEAICLDTEGHGRWTVAPIDDEECD